MFKHLFTGLILLGVAGAAQAAGIVNATVEGNTLRADISVGGVYAAALTLEFEDAVGLSVENLGLSAQLIDPNAPGLVSRFSDPSLISVANGFPVMLVIDPPATGGLSFSGVVGIELYTHNLNYDPAVPLRLFSAESGGQFRDITERVSSGSYRCRGSKGQFSEFLVVLDTRTTTEAVRAKFDALGNLLAAQQSALPAALFNALDSLLSHAENAAQLGYYNEAIDYLDAFSTTVQEAADAHVISNVWRSSEQLTNSAGLLRAGAGTLRFSLGLASNSL